MGRKVGKNHRVTREEGKHVSPAQSLVGFSGKLLSRKLKPLRRSRSDKIREKALEQDYLDKCNTLVCRLKDHRNLLDLMLQLTCCNGEVLCNSTLCQELKERHANSVTLIKFLLEQVGTTLDVLPKQTQVSLHEVLSIDEKLTAKLGKVFRSNFGKEGKFKQKCKASQSIPSAAAQGKDKFPVEECYQMFVHGIKDGRPLVLMLKKDESGQALRDYVQDKCPNLPSSFILLHQGRKISLRHTLREQGFAQDCNIHVHFGLCGVVASSSSSGANTEVLEGPRTAPSQPVQPPSSSAEVPVRRQTRKRQIYVESTVDDGCYVCTKSSLQSLCKYFTTNPLCEFCGNDYKWGSATFSSQGHVCKIEVPCVCNDSVTWLSSGVLGHPTKYYANVRMVHAFTCTGLTETQYHGFAEAAGIGCVMDKTIDTIYKDQGLGYMSVVQELCNKTMADARAEVKATQDYIASGDCIITDARHDSSRSAMHSTVSAISMSNKKIISVCNWSRADERSAPSREVPMTKQLVTNLTETEGYNVTEVAHDCVRSLKNWFEQRGIKNSFDTWHGTKGVARDMKKVCSGAQRDEGKTWFTELSDKAKATKTHFYWAMRNNDGTDAGFQKYLLNIVDHYQGKHDLCHKDSRCRHPGYVCSKKPLTSPLAKEAYMKAITKTTIYKNPSDYLLCRDTFYIETFHVVVLIYAPKRINFGDCTYVMRVHLAILDWNENVDREVSSIQFYQHSRHPDRMAPTRVLRPKTFTFRQAIWNEVFKRNKIDVNPLPV